MASDDTVLRLINTLYSCADGESSWSAFLDAVAEDFGASLVGIATNSHLQAVNGIDPIELDKYQQHYMKINPWHIGGPKYPEGQVLLTEEVLPVNVYHRTAFYNEWGKKNRVVHAVGGAIRSTPTTSVFFSINRGDAAGPYDEDARGRAQMLMPHIQRAVNLHERMLALEQRAWVLDTLAYPMMYVGSDGGLRWANEAAESLLRSEQGLRVREGRLHAQLNLEDVKLQKMLREDRCVVGQRIDGYGGWLRVTRGDDGSEMSLFLTRPPSKMRRAISVPVGGVGDGSSGFLIFVAVQAVDENALAARVRGAWGLTAAECALALEMLECDGLQGAAEKLGVTKNTVKSQLAAIFQKSGARRQSELVRKLMAMAVMGVGRE